MDDFKVLGNGYKSDFKRRISEAIYIRRLNPDLNKKKEAYKLSLFHWVSFVTSIDNTTFTLQ